MEAREKSCWKTKKSEWTEASVRNMIETIHCDFMKRYVFVGNRKNQTSWSTVYGRMSRIGVFKKMKEARRVQETGGGA